MDTETLQAFAHSDTAITDALERVSTFGELKELVQNGEFDFYTKAPEVTPHLLVWKKAPDQTVAARHLEKVAELLEGVDEDMPFTREQIKSTIGTYAEQEGRGAVLWPMRTALSGQEKSPDPFLIAEVLGKKETVRRLYRARDTLLVGVEQQ